MAMWASHLGIKSLKLLKYWWVTYAFFTSSSAALFKVSFLSLVDFLGFANKGLNGGVDHVLDLALRHGFGTFSNGGKSLLDGSWHGWNLSIDLGIGVSGQLSLGGIDSVLLLDGEK